MLTVTLAFSFFGESTFAKVSDAPIRVLSEEVEIKDIDELFERAKENVNDLDANVIEDKLDASLTKEGGGASETAVDLISTSQLLKVSEKNDGTRLEEFAVTAFTADVGQQMASGSSSRSASLWDESYSVRAYATYYFTRHVKGDYTYHDITRATGGWERADTSVTISQKKVIYGASGQRLKDSGYVQQSQTMYPSGNTFAYNAPSSWEPVITLHGVGVSTWVTMNRGRSTWTLKLVCQN